MNILVLILEILYYSLFMKFAKKEGKLWQYIIIFSILTILNLIIGNNVLLIYLLLIILPIILGKYLFKINMLLYDFYNVLIMLLIKIIIEAICYNIFIVFFNYYTTIFLMEFFKFIVLFLIKNKIFNINNKIKLLWQRNNFYIRYFTTIFLIMYIIFTIISIAIYN